MEAHSQKIYIVFHLTQEMYNKKAISHNAKLQHYQSVTRPKTQYASEFLNLNNKGYTEKLEIQGQRFYIKFTDLLSKKTMSIATVLAHNYIKTAKDFHTFLKNVD